MSVLELSLYGDEPIKLFLTHPTTTVYLLFSFMIWLNKGRGQEFLLPPEEVRNIVMSTPISFSLSHETTRPNFVKFFCACCLWPRLCHFLAALR